MQDLDGNCPVLRVSFAQRPCIFCFARTCLCSGEMPLCGGGGGGGVGGGKGYHALKNHLIVLIFVAKLIIYNLSEPMSLSKR